MRKRFLYLIVSSVYHCAVPFIPELALNDRATTCVVFVPCYKMLTFVLLVGSETKLFPPMLLFSGPHIFTSSHLHSNMSKASIATCCALAFCGLNVIGQADSLALMIQSCNDATGSFSDNHPSRSHIRLATTAARASEYDSSMVNTADRAIQILAELDKLPNAPA